MIRAALLLSLAACNLGIGTDPQSGPHPCVPGNERIGNGCFVPRAAIVVDATTDDWNAPVPVAVTSSCVDQPCDVQPMSIQLAALGPSDDDIRSLAVRARFASPPPIDVRLVAIITASPLRPATAGVDRLILDSGVRYEKNGFAVESPAQPFLAARTVDGFEAVIDDLWLTYQGAGQIAFTAERLVGSEWRAVAPAAPVTACWSFHDSLGAGCEALP
jgi:hypothetical protein